jgi:hypothetical protein
MVDLWLRKNGRIGTCVPVGSFLHFEESFLFLGGKIMKVKVRNTLAILLVLVMALSLLPLAALADHSLTPIESNLSALTVSGQAVYSSSRTAVEKSDAGYYTYTYTIVLGGTQSDLNGQTVTVEFTKSPNASSNCLVSTVTTNSIFWPKTKIRNGEQYIYTETISNGVASFETYLYPDLDNSTKKYNTYIFNFTCRGARNPVAVDANANFEMRFGDPNYLNTEPEKFMTFEPIAGQNPTYNAVYKANPSTGVTTDSNYYPERLSFYVTSGKEMITSMTGDHVYFYEYDSNGNLTNSGTSPSSTNLNAGSYVLKLDESTAVTSRSITIAWTDSQNNNHQTVVYFDAPHNNSSTTGTPSTALGYLTGLTQYANNTSWGSISTDGYNSLASASLVKGAGTGYVSTGFSLGTLGGYVVYDFSSNPIQESTSHPYGVDFIVYGNPFIGNPEPAAVQVYARKYTLDANNNKSYDTNYAWYELAGSKYYASDTVRNQTVVYTKAGNVVNAGVGANETAADNALAPFRQNAPTWFPTFGSMNHEATSGVNSNLLNPYISTYTANRIVFNGVTKIGFAAVSADYSFGYADVVPNGSNYGTAVNPYTEITSSKTGGDGFDLAWAVDPSNGQPVLIDEAEYVRIYSATLNDAQQFGETSPEICGIYKAVTGTGGTQTTNAKLYNGSYVEQTMNANKDNKTPLTAGTYLLISTEDNVFINGERVDASGLGVSVPLAQGEMKQIITQSGTEEPFITLLIGQ